MSTNVQRDTYARSIKVNEKLSIEHDYPHFNTDQMHMHEKINFEFNTFSVFILFSSDAMS